MPVVTNIPLFKTEYNAMIKDIDTGLRRSRDEMMTAMIQLAQEEIKGKRQPGEKAEAGKPPKNRTGNLRRSIKGFKSATGNTYLAVVGPTMVYSRAVEVGGKYAPRSWQGTTAMSGFPYMKPAYEKFTKNGIMQQILRKNLGKF